MLPSVWLAREAYDCMVDATVWQNAHEWYERYKVTGDRPRAITVEQLAELKVRQADTFARADDLVSGRSPFVRG